MVDLLVEEYCIGREISSTIHFLIHPWNWIYFKFDVARSCGKEEDWKT